MPLLRQRQGYSIKPAGTPWITPQNPANCQTRTKICSQLYSQPVDKSVNKPVQTEENYRLTEENWTTIDPMIGLSEDDIAAFFNNN